uniref:TFIIS N-terminal domain-containing protein n=1 Tax=Arundo donax TaxID=35708 RepID=A0A0A9CNM9_ARUDO
MLEDFFTLTEMKDGMSTVTRIGELVSEIQKLKNDAGLHTADMIRQRSTTANTLASTKNEECLRHFVQLNGVGFLNNWLQDAQNCGDDVRNSAEDLIIAILTALECFPIDNEQSISSGAMSTVHQLIAHRNANINQKARALSQKWSNVPKYGTNGKNFDTKEACQTDQHKLPEASQETENDQHSGANEVGNSVEESKAEVMSCSDAPLPDPSLTNDNADATKQPPVLTSPNSSNGNAALGDVNSLASAPACPVGLENVSITKETSAPSDVGLATNRMHLSNSMNAKSGTGQGAPVDVTAAAMSVEPNKPDNLFVSSKMDLEDNIVSTSSSIKESDRFAADRLHLDKDTAQTLNHLATVTRDLKDLFEESTGKEEGPTSSSSSDGMGIGNEYMLKRCMKSFGDSSKATETTMSALKGEKSTPLTDYDDTDALEVARLVAIEVEREVIDYRGPFCGSPDINSRNADSLDLEARRQPEPIVDGLNDNKSSSTGVDSGSSSSLKEDGSGITDGSAPISRKNTRSGDLCDFDLNENQCAEETDCNSKSVLNNSVNLSTPIAVAASRGSSVFPARLQFEGELGWKGSAATSAFRPASPRRTPDAEKSLSASSHKTSNMLFDLNVADSDSAASGEPLSTAILAASSDLPSKDTSAAVGVSGGLKLDLNFSCGDEEDAITASNVPPMWNRQQFNGNWSQPSSSSSRQPAVRNFDLNDKSIADGSAQVIDGFFVKTSSRDMSEHSSVTIMGKRIIVGQKEHRHQQQHNFLGPSTESRVPSRSIQAYAHTPDYGVVSYPSQPAVSFPPAFYAPGGVPYMVDAKGAPMIPPLSGLGLGISHPSFSSRAAPPSSSELSYYHPSMDFNYGLLSEGARREAGNYWPVPYQGQTIFVDERMRNMSQGGSSGLVLKRKEPESGWDMYPRR